jgi:hypothetical protein
LEQRSVYSCPKPRHYLVLAPLFHCHHLFFVCDHDAAKCLIIVADPGIHNLSSPFPGRERTSPPSPSFFLVPKGRRRRRTRRRRRRRGRGRRGENVSKRTPRGRKEFYNNEVTYSRTGHVKKRGRDGIGFSGLRPRAQEKRRRGEEEKRRGGSREEEEKE